MATDIEQVALSRIVYDGDIVSFINAGVKTEFFVTERWSLAWTWVYEYWSRHNEVPAITAFMRQFPNWEFEATDEPGSAIIEELLLRRRAVLVEEALIEAVDSMRAGEHDDVLSRLRGLLNDVDVETSRSAVTLSNDVITAVINRAMEDVVGGLLGIPTGFQSIDEATGGLQPEQLITVTALPKHGKTSIAIKIAISAQHWGAKVMIITFEMATRELMHLYLSLGAGVGLTNIIRGRLSENDKKKLREFEEYVDMLPSLIIIHDVGAVLTVGGIAAKIQQYEPDLIIVDGTYMMDDERGEPAGTPRALTNITRALKRLCQTSKKTIVNTTQSLIAKTPRAGGVNMGSIGYTSSFAQDSDALIGLDREDLTLPTATLKIIAARNALGMEVELDFDHSIGVIAERSGFFTNAPSPAKASEIDDGD